MTKIVSRFSEDTIGTDGEFFMVDKHGKYISSEGLMGGKKNDPILCDGGGYLEDCVSVEINIDPVKRSDGRQTFIDRIGNVIEQVKIRAHQLDLSVDIQPAVLFDKDQLNSRQAQESGCSTSYNVWTNKPHRVPKLDDTAVRFASGDIHIGWPEADRSPEQIQFRKNYIKALDLVIGMNEVANTPRTMRSNGYGALGVHRPTEYGVEYKSPGNFWMKTPYARGWVYDVCFMILDDVRFNGEDSVYVHYAEDYSEAAQLARERWSEMRAIGILDNVPGLPSFPRGV